MWKSEHISVYFYQLELTEVNLIRYRPVDRVADYEYSFIDQHHEWTNEGKYCVAHGFDNTGNTLYYNST